MTIDLDTKLKNAGIGDGSSGKLDGTKITIISGLTLSELIAACGNDFEGLWRRVNPDKTLKSWVGNVFADNGCVEAATPEEAVAKLLLEIRSADKDK